MNGYCVMRIYIKYCKDYNTVYGFNKQGLYITLVRHQRRRRVGIYGTGRIFFFFFSHSLKLLIRIQSFIVFN